MSYKYQFIKCVMEYIPNDVSIQIESYLTDSNGLVFVNSSSLAIDAFTVQTYKSSLPSSGYDSYLSIIASKFINEKYNSTFGGYASKDSRVITQISDTSAIVKGLYVYGTGIPEDATVLSVRDKNSIEISKSAQTTGNITLNLSSNGWQIDYSQIAYLNQIIDFASL